MASPAEELVLAQASGGRVWLGDLPEGGRSVSAEFVRRVWLGDEAVRLGPRGLWLAGGRVEGKFDLVLTAAPHPLAFEGMSFDAAPNLGGCRLPGLAFVDCDLPGFVARGLSAEHSVSFRSCRIAGAVELREATIGADLDLSDARVEGRDGTALLASGATVSGSVILGDGFSAAGSVRLVQTEVGGAVECFGATLDVPDGEALVADGARIDGSVELTEGFRSTGTVRFVRAEIKGDLRCSGARVSNPPGDTLLLRRVTIGGNLGIEGVHSEGSIELVGASIGDSLYGAAATLDNAGRNALVADSAHVAGSIDLADGFTANGTVRLVNVTVGGDLHLSGATLSSREELALVLDRAVIDGNANLDERFESEGIVRLVGARIGGELNCGFATFVAERAQALACDDAVIEQNVNLGPGFSANGMVSFVHAKVGGAFDCSGAKLWNLHGVALAADAAEVGTSMLLTDEFSAVGEVHLIGARIAADLDCSGGRFENTHKVALRAAGVDAGALLLRGTQLLGAVSFFKAHAGTLHDDLGATTSGGSWDIGGPLLLAGFRYDRFGPGTTWETDARFAWLAKTEAFDPGAWQQLINVYHAHGRDEDARRAAVARENDRLARAGLPAIRAAGRWILRATIGYGYRPWIAGIWALGVVLLFVLALWLGPDLVREPDARGSAEPLVYAADTFLPIVDLGEASEWSAVGWLQWIEWLVILLGWALTTIFVAGFTRVVRT
jgi:hypothetical protein